MRHRPKLSRGLFALAFVMPLGISCVMTIVSLIHPMEVDWNTFEKSGVTDYFPSTRQEVLEDPHGQGLGYSVGIVPFAVWVSWNEYIDGAGGRYSDAQANAWCDAHPVFTHSLPLGFASFRVWHSGETSGGFVFPLWLPLLVSAIVAAMGLRKWHRRPVAGLCQRCSYDLRAHAPGNRCPECGTVWNGK